MTTHTIPVTIEEIMADPPRDQRWEIIDGELHVTPPAGHEHGGTAGHAFYHLYDWVRRHRCGVVYAAETGFILRRAPDTLVAPDVAFVRTERIPPRGPGFFKGHPDLAVEVVSPRDRRKAVEGKVERWLDAGTSEVWVVWTRKRQVTVHRPGGDPLNLHEADTLTAGPVLPGFTLPVAELFV